MGSTVAIVFLAFILGGVVTQEFYMDCIAYCEQCKDQVAEDCPINMHLIPDGDLCRCCDHCGYRRGFQESCLDKFELKRVHNNIYGWVMPVKCEPGYECVSGRCAKSQVGFCPIFRSGVQSTYFCDNEEHLLPIQCSKYHCWCIDPLTGTPIINTKIAKPISSENVSYCYYLISKNGILDLLLPGFKQYSGSTMRLIKQEMEQQNFRRTLPENIHQSSDLGKRDKEFQRKQMRT